MSDFDITWEKSKFGKIAIIFNKKAINYAKTIDITYPKNKNSVFIITTEKGYQYIQDNCPNNLTCQPYVK